VKALGSDPDSARRAPGALDNQALAARAALEADIASARHGTFTFSG
jgi:hypothetical protein